MSSPNRTMVRFRRCSTGSTTPTTGGSTSSSCSPSGAILTCSCSIVSVRRLRTRRRASPTSSPGRLRPSPHDVLLLRPHRCLRRRPRRRSTPRPRCPGRPPRSSRRSRFAHLQPHRRRSHPTHPAPTRRPPTRRHRRRVNPPRRRTGSGTNRPSPPSPPSPPSQTSETSRTPNHNAVGSPPAAGRGVPHDRLSEVHDSVRRRLDHAVHELRRRPDRRRRVATRYGTADRLEPGRGDPTAGVRARTGTRLASPARPGPCAGAGRVAGHRRAPARRRTAGMAVRSSKAPDLSAFAAGQRA